jgi:hypothetical protein
LYKTLIFLMQILMIRLDADFLPVCEEPRPCKTKIATLPIPVLDARPDKLYALIPGITGTVEFHLVERIWYDKGRIASTAGWSGT